MSTPNPQENPTESLEGQTAASTDGASISPIPPGAGENETPDGDSRCVRQVAVEIPADAVSKEFESTLQQYTKVARIPGFRKGKVPASIVRTRFAEEIRNDVLESLVPQYIREAIVKEGYRPVSEPQVHSLVNEPGKPVRFQAAFEVLPDIQLGNYQDMKLDVAEIKVTDDDVEAELKRLQERQSSFDPVDEDRPLQDGDFAQISFQAVPKDEIATQPEQNPVEGAATESVAKPDAKQPVQMDDILVEIGASEFSENLRGAKSGEERIFEISYPADHEDKRIAGKTLVYTAKINALKRKTTPGLTDDFAKELNQDFQTLDDLRKRLQENIFAGKQYHSLEEARQKLLNQLADSYDFPVPETLVRNQIDFRLEQWLRNLAAQGMRTEDMKRLDFKRLRAGQRDAAVKEVRAHLLLEKIAEVENIEVSDEEVQRQVQAVAQQSKETPEAVERRLIENGGIDRIRRRIRSDKALRFLYDKSTSNARDGAVQE